MVQVRVLSGTEARVCADRARLTLQKILLQ
jgi:hypothetical protein